MGVGHHWCYWAGVCWDRDCCALRAERVFVCRYNTMPKKEYVYAELCKFAEEVILPIGLATPNAVSLPLRAYVICHGLLRGTHGHDAGNCCVCDHLHQYLKTFFKAAVTGVLRGVVWVHFCNPKAPKRYPSVKQWARISLDFSGSFRYIIQGYICLRYMKVGVALWKT